MKVLSVAHCSVCQGKIVPEKFWSANDNGECRGCVNGRYCSVHSEEEIEAFENAVATGEYKVIYE